MQELMLPLLRCPVTRSALELQVISTSEKIYNNIRETIVWEGILWSEKDWFFPIVKGIPRLLLESFLEFPALLSQHMPDYQDRRAHLLNSYKGIIAHAQRKNRRTRQSFSKEWSLYNYAHDKTWNADKTEMLERFLAEVDETTSSLSNKIIFDAGCGNGALNSVIASYGATILGMDFSASVERAFDHNKEKKALFIQGDVQLPPVSFRQFDIVHSSGVLICTNNTELSFSCIEPGVKTGGKLSVWLYHPRKDVLHNLFNKVRNITSRLPIRVQYYLYLFTLYPASLIIKRLKGNRENRREIMIHILDWFSPQFRWEHTPSEASSWFSKRGYRGIKVTTTDKFGFNIIGIKSG